MPGMRGLTSRTKPDMIVDKVREVLKQFWDFPTVRCTHFLDLTAPDKGAWNYGAFVAMVDILTMQLDGVYLEQLTLSLNGETVCMTISQFLTKFEIWVRNMHSHRETTRTADANAAMTAILEAVNEYDRLGWERPGRMGVTWQFFLSISRIHWSWKVAKAVAKPFKDIHTSLHTTQLLTARYGVCAWEDLQGETCSICSREYVPKSCFFEAARAARQAGQNRNVWMANIPYCAFPVILRCGNRNRNHNTGDFCLNRWLAFQLRNNNRLFVKCPCGHIIGAKRHVNYVHIQQIGYDIGLCGLPEDLA